MALRLEIYLHKKKMECLEECSLKTYMELIDIIDRQNKLIAELVNENLEQEAIIENLMVIQLSE